MPAPFDLTALNAAITRLETIDEGIAELVSKLNALRGDPAALDAAVAKLNENIDSVVAAIVAGTPAEEEPAPEPAPEV